jgi:small subunit ribosomal protein S17e
VFAITNSFINQLGLLPAIFGDTAMGRIKTQQIKSKGDDLFALHNKDYQADFSQNKLLVGKHAVVRSKKLRNVLAGYLTRKAKKAQNE